MQYNKIKDQEVSLLGFGCMRLPVDEAGLIAEEQAKEMLDYAYDKGVNYYDTAYTYHEGESENFVGRWLKSKDRTSLNIATKLPMWAINKVEDVHRIFEEQLSKIQTDYFDFYLLHALDKEKWDTAVNLDVIKIMEEYKKAGKIRYLGFSFHSDYELFEKIILAYKWDFCQIQLNYVDVEHQAGLKGLKLAKENNIPVIIMEPVKGGLLASLPDKEKSLLQTKESEATIAFRWLFNQEGIKVILSGMSRFNEVVENIKVISENKSCSEEELQRIEEVKKSLDLKQDIPCTACGYCMPCPSGVNIPGCFRYYNVGSRYENFILAKRSYDFAIADDKASLCSECMVCLSLCPQAIDIPTCLKEVVNKLEKES